MKEFIREENKKIRDQLLWREPAVLRESGPREIVIESGRYINFSSNDYLGYSKREEVVNAAIEALQKYGAGGRASRLVSGTLDIHKELESRLAELKGTEASLLYPTGFMANLGVISGLLGAGDCIILDRLDHASIIDAAKLSRCRMLVYEHACLPSLEKVLLRARSYKKRLVVTDSLFSMDGDFCPLPGLAELCRKHNAWLMIDDAHATGVLGSGGSGMAEHYNMRGKVDIVMGTLSKALGSQGGFVCGTKDMIEYLVNRSRPFIYTTAISPPSCGAALAALELVKTEPSKRNNLLSLSRKLRFEIKNRFPENAVLLEEDVSQIIPFRAGSREKAIRLSQGLKEEGIFTPAIRPPTVPENECRLRISLTSEHTEEDILKLLACLKKLV